jgi:opacity protein-like surface antigen
MMKSMMGVIVAAGLVAGGAAWAAEGQSPFHVENTLRVGYDDNVTYVDRNSANEVKDSFYITEEISLSLDHVYDSGFLGIRYRPSLTWYEELYEDDHTDWSHVLDATWSQQLSRRLTLSLQDMLYFYDRADVVDADGALRQPNYSYFYNSAVASLNVMLTPKARISGTGRYQVMQYDDDVISLRDDFDIMAAGLSFGLQVGKSATVFVDGAYEDISYDNALAQSSEAVYTPGYTGAAITQVPDRSAQMYSIGLGLENTFSPNLMGRIRAGYSAKDMDGANVADDDSPYGELSLTIAPAPTTRLTLGAGYSMYQSGLTTYANQQRTTLTANLAHDLTAKITLSLIGQYYMSDYDSESSVELVDEASVEDGSESAITAGARVSYAVTRNNFVDVGYTYTLFDSDFAGRGEIERNRVDVGWRIRM